MVADVLINLLTSLVELLRISLILSLPMFACAVAIKFLVSKIGARTGLGFAWASFFSTYLVVLALIIVLYFWPLYLGFSESPLTAQPKPPYFELTAIDFLAALPSFIFKFLLDALVFTILVLPMEFIMLFVFDSLKNKYKIPKTASIFAATFAAAVVTVAILLLVFPFVPVALVQLLYFT